MIIMLQKRVYDQTEDIQERIKIDLSYNVMIHFNGCIEYVYTLCTHTHTLSHTHI